MSAYTDKCKEGIQRINDLTADYQAALLAQDHGLAAVIRGQLGAARAYLQGITDAGELLIDAGDAEPVPTFAWEVEQ